ncbi:hypothetical protein EV363DRAFT_1299702 [Boletus edulis]|nr:hypothetical protein EV363DRAFT_1299702 [Boletus edulis]
MRIGLAARGGTGNKNKNTVLHFGGDPITSVSTPLTESSRRKKQRRQIKRHLNEGNLIPAQRHSKPVACRGKCKENESSLEKGIKGISHTDRIMKGLSSEAVSGIEDWLWSP